MKTLNLFLFFFFLFSINSYLTEDAVAYSPDDLMEYLKKKRPYDLPKCEGSDPDNWNDCSGVYTRKDGRSYDGDWKDGKRNGYGSAKWPNGNFWIGEIKDNSFHGMGWYKWGLGPQRGDQYIGEFKDGNYHRGTYINKDRHMSDILWTYDGDWKDNKRHGKGTFTWADGSKYVGEWKNGLKQGKGTYTDTKGKSTSGRYEYDKKVGRHVEINY